MESLTYFDCPSLTAAANELIGHYIRKSETKANIKLNTLFFWFFCFCSKVFLLSCELFSEEKNNFNLIYDSFRGLYKNQLICETRNTRLGVTDRRRRFGKWMAAKEPSDWESVPTEVSVLWESDYIGIELNANRIRKITALAVIRYDNR